MLKLAWYLITDRDYWTNTEMLPAPVRELTSALHSPVQRRGPVHPGAHRRGG
jgi:hypothetical protein